MWKYLFIIFIGVVWNTSAREISLRVSKRELPPENEEQDSSNNVTNP